MVFNKKGFTLIELITVIAIIAIISGGLIYLSPKFITKQRLKNDAWQVLNDIKEVQERARAQLERLKIEIDLNSKTSYKYEKRKNAFDDESSKNIVNKKLSLNIFFKSVRVANTTYGTGKVTFMYDEWGVPKKIEIGESGEVVSDSGEIVITIETPILKNNNNQNMSVDIIISPGTGRLRMDGPK